MSSTTKSRNNQKKVAKAKAAGDTEEEARLRSEKYDYVHKDDIKQGLRVVRYKNIYQYWHLEKSSNSKFGVGLIFGAVLGGAAIYGLSKITKDDNNEEKKWKQNRN
uniref:Uncharacterized protein n=1 Tax=Panagrolaimus davidi TaxID=227884 RepID=A0A914QGI2_9BILA